MKLSFHKVCKWLRLMTVLSAAFLADVAKADWLWWTVDFARSWGGAAPKENPAGSDSGYDIYLVVKEAGEDGAWKSTVKGGTLKDNYIGSIVQTDISEWNSNSYLFFVEMVKEGESAAKTKYLTPGYTYADLVAAGHFTKTMEAVDAIWNAGAETWSIPEPTSGMLVLFGFGLLMLRRKRAWNGHQE